MHAQAPMAKDQTFKLRLDAQDRARLEAVAAHFSAPAATAIRILIKERFEGLPSRGRRLPTMATCTVGGEPAGSHWVVYLDGAETTAARSAYPRSFGRTKGGEWTEEPRSQKDLDWQAQVESAGVLRVEGAPGSWYLTTLLAHGWKPDDCLALDAGQDWQVTNPAALLDELRTIVGDAQFSAFQRLARRLKKRDEREWADVFPRPEPKKKAGR